MGATVTKHDLENPPSNKWQKACRKIWTLAGTDFKFKIVFLTMSEFVCEFSMETDHKQ